MEWTRDRRLKRRMALALTLSLAGYVVLLAPVVWYSTLAVGVVVGSILLGIVGLLVWQADFLTYYVTSAVSIDRESYPALFDAVDRLASQADMARPPVAVIPSDEPNALSAGTGDRQVLFVTLGLLKELDGEQLEAVLAHELAHCKNGDSTVMTVAGFPATVSLAMFSVGVRNLDAKALVIGYFAFPLFAALLAIPLVVATLPATLVLARYREYAADRGAVAITGKPVALAEALAALHNVEQPPDTDLRRLTNFNAFCIVPTGSSLLDMLGTHPPIHRRIARLRKLQEGMASSSRPSK